MNQNSVNIVRGSPPNGIYGKNMALPASAAWYAPRIILYLALKVDLI